MMPSRMFKFYSWAAKSALCLVKILKSNICPPQVKNILYHCVKEAVSSLKSSSAEEDDEEENSWQLLHLVHTVQRGTQFPSAPCPRLTSLLTTVPHDRRCSGQSWSCDPEDLTVWTNRITHPGGQQEARPTSSSPQTFSAKRRQTRAGELAGLTGTKPPLREDRILGKSGQCVSC